MQVYIVLHLIIMFICLLGLYRSWQVLKQIPQAIEFAKWPLSLLIVLAVCSFITVIDLSLFDFLSNQVINVLAAVQLMYSAIVAAFCIPYLVRNNRD